MPLSALSYANLHLNPQRVEQLQRRQQEVQQKQHVTQTRDAAGEVQEVKRIDDPDVVQVCINPEVWRAAVTKTSTAKLKGWHKTRCIPHDVEGV
jgi:hypothetical protein